MALIPVQLPTRLVVYLYLPSCVLMVLGSQRSGLEVLEVAYISLAHGPAIFSSEPPKIAPFSFPSDIVDEGSYVQVMCSVVKGDEPLKITWHLQGAEVSSEPSLTTTMLGTRSSILTITNVGYRHAGAYACMAQNPAGAVTHSAELRVKGRTGNGS